MIILDATDRSLQALLAGAVTTNQLPVVASYVDVTTTTYAPATEHTATNSTTPVTIVSAPAASTQRQVKFLTIRNADTAAATVTIQYVDSAVTRELVRFTLAVGDALVYTDGEGFRVFDSAGSLKQTGGDEGPTGPTGPTGPGVGATGATGATGPTGATGHTGTAGAKGATGHTGTAGAKGATGHTGTAGVKGATGHTGTAGAKGATGHTGTAGAKGATGHTGTAGAKGATGATGATTPGHTGATGHTGTAGAKGATGHTGTAGAKGATGHTGTAGAKGATGHTGTAGAKGATGHTGTAGAKGATGHTGTAGAKGATGATGATTPGHTGATGHTGADSTVPGPTGPTGPAIKALEFVIDGGGSAITTGPKGDLEVPAAVTIASARLFADKTGSIKVDIWKDTYANFPPTNTDTITGANEPTIASGVKDQDVTLTSWTTTLSAGDVLRYNVDSCVTITRCLVSLRPA